MLKRYSYGIFVVLLSILLVMSGIHLAQRSSGPDPAPYDMGPRPGEFFPSFSVYYVEGEQLHRVDRLIRTVRRSAVLNALAAYELVAEEGLYDRYGKLLHLDILDVYEGEKTIFLKVNSKGFEGSGFTDENFYLYLMSLVNTITEVAPGKRISFLFEDVVENPVLYGVDMNRLFGRDERVVLHSAEEVYQALEFFLRAIERQNTHIAYQRISPDDRRYYSYADFFPYAKAYHNLHLNELPEDYQVSSTEEGYQVVLHYPQTSASPREIWYLQPIDEGIYVLMHSEPFEIYAQENGKP